MVSQIQSNRASFSRCWITVGAFQFLVRTKSHRNQPTELSWWDKFFVSALVKKMKENEKNGKHFFSVYFKEHGNTYNCYPKEQMGREKTNHAVAARQRAAITSNSASWQLVWDCKAACSLLCHTQGSCGCTHPAGSPPGCYSSRETAA